MAEGTPILEFKRYSTPKTTTERIVISRISGLNLKGDFLSDPADLSIAKFFCDGVISAFDFLALRHNRLKVIEEKDGIYVVRIGTVTDKQEKICGYEKAKRNWGIFLREYKGFTFYDASIPGVADKKILKVVNAFDICEKEIEFSIRPAGDLNKAIEAAKRWVTDRPTDDDSGAEERDLIADATESLHHQKNINKMKEAKFQMVPLADILPSSTNNMQREAWELQPDALKELAESIIQKGVISPVLLRPDGKPGKYYLVCGERRFQASKLAKQTEIPACIKEISDEEAFDLQITENLQRKDVHPLKEAQAYKLLMDAHPAANTVKELALRFGKNEQYIVHRLALNKLIPELKKEFFEGALTIGHALLLCRLTEADQKQCLKSTKLTYGHDAGSYISVKGMTKYIQDELVRNLTKAPFNIHDATLVVNAGSCDTCPKRSGTGELFSDIKEKDRCFDGACFQLKSIRNVLSFIEENQNADDPVHLIKDNYGTLNSAIQKHIDKNKLKVLISWDDYDKCEKSDKAAEKAFHVGEGVSCYIKLKTKSKSSGSSSSSLKSSAAKKTPEQKINELKQQLQRAKEDLREKIAEEAMSRLRDLKPYKDGDTTPLSKAEFAVILQEMEGEVYNPLQAKFSKELAKLKPDGLKKDDPAYDFTQLTMVTPLMINQMLRAYILDKLDNNYGGDSSEPIIAIAKGYKGIDLKKIEDQCNAQFKKSEEDLNKKIADIRAAKKNPAPAKKSSKK